MSTIGSGCHELRIIDESVTWRIVCAVEADAIVVLDVFAKKTNKTPKEILSTCKRRLKAFRST
ncbi:MAG TPA: type II toxin-antitoxin system RelE/ParE family toxin, partial [Candidatus Eisenbacteria bacterium]|nr:type II toxin-antitoxin system RelE/ParE family toxin [Candidatus Eisenbacteria bacterium]